MRIAFLLPLALLAGCASFSPEAKVRAKLENAGLSPRMAGCMAHRMVARLSNDQLRALAKLGGVAKAEDKHMAMDEIVARMRTLDDPQTVKVVSKAALVCSIDRHA